MQASIITKLSPRFSFAEAIASQEAARRGIDNTPPTSIIAIMRQTAMEMECVRALLGVPVHVNSWYRSPELNAAIGSKPTSQHLKGEAVDFIAPDFGTPLAICKLIIKHKDTIPFDQLILEHSWVHISFAISSGKPRNQVLSLLATGGYSTGLTDNKGSPL